MKRFRCGFLVLLIALIAALPASADKSKSLYSKGQQAEAKQDYEQAYKYFKQAPNRLSIAPHLSARSFLPPLRMFIAGRCCGTKANSTRR